jgi:hypothetical protein
MKTWFRLKFQILAVFLPVFFTNTAGLTGQTTMGILPVDVSAVSSSLINSQQWQSLSSKLHDLLIGQLSGEISVTKLTREHILLLLKEIPAPDPEKLDAESCQVICKKEKLQYLLKYSMESIQFSDKVIVAICRTMILDGNDGTVFWEKSFKTSRTVSSSQLTDQILFDEVFKPIITDISKEIKTLNY